MQTVDAYIAKFEPEIQIRLQTLREIFLELLPDTQESIRYNMPAYTVGNAHLYFAAYKHHIGFYPVYTSIEIESDVAIYRAKGTKDSLHFKHNAP